MPGPRRHQFDTTRWTIVNAVGASDSAAARHALAELCEAYWYPIYAYVRRQGHDSEDARDVTQAFFAQLLERNDLVGLDPARGRFRSFLLAATRHFVLNDAVRRRALKRGGGDLPASLDFDTAEDRYRKEPADPETPEHIFERRWALTLIDAALNGLRDEWRAAGKDAEFEALRECLMGEPPEGGYEALSRVLGSNANATRVAVHRLRRRFRQRLREAIAETVLSEEEVDDEIRHLFSVLGR